MGDDPHRMLVFSRLLHLRTGPAASLATVDPGFLTITVKNDHTVLIERRGRKTRHRANSFNDVFGAWFADWFFLRSSLQQFSLRAASRKRPIASLWRSRLSINSTMVRNADDCVSEMVRQKSERYDLSLSPPNAA
jgi:hypothetical protein